MKLVRFGEKGRERPGIIDAEGRIRDVSHLVEDFSGASLLDTIALLREGDLAGARHVHGEPRLGVPLAGIGNILCIGRNYVEHAAETGNVVMDEPIIFSKATSSINGPNDPVVIPKNSNKSDWEVELGVVIGRRARYVPEADAFDYVAGYCIINDVSEREFQLERSGQWIKGKSCETYAPIGPWLVTCDEIPDPQKLALSTTVNGRRFQNGHTADMVFQVPFLIHYISQFMTLLPGDLIATGTPAGVGMAANPPVFLTPGDVMELEVEGLGIQRQKVMAFDPALFAQL